MGMRQAVNYECSGRGVPTGEILRKTSFSVSAIRCSDENIPNIMLEEIFMIV